MSAPDPWKAHGLMIYALVGFGLFVLAAVYLPCLVGGACP